MYTIIHVYIHICICMYIDSVHVYVFYNTEISLKFIILSFNMAKIIIGDETKLLKYSKNFLLSVILGKAVL